MTIRRDAVQAVIVAFNPGPSLERVCEALISGGVPVLVVDNASTSGADVLAACEAGGAVVLALPTNVGVSGGLAAGLARTQLEWLLTFDQDSVADDDFLEALLSSSATLDERIAVVGPNIVDEASGDLLQGHPWTEAVTAPLVMTSGALCRVSALHSVGGFREDLFIDHVDHDICLRLRKQGHLIAIEPTAVLQHSVGNMRTHQVAGVDVRNSHHSADRQYFKYRNFLLLLRDGTAFTDLHWTLRTLLALLWGPLKILVFEDDKAAKLTGVAAGVRDGVLGRAGPKR